MPHSPNAPLMCVFSPMKRACTIRPVIALRNCATQLATQEGIRCFKRGQPANRYTPPPNARFVTGHAPSPAPRRTPRRHCAPPHHPGARAAAPPPTPRRRRGRGDDVRCGAYDGPPPTTTTPAATGRGGGGQRRPARRHQRPWSWWPSSSGDRYCLVVKRRDHYAPRHY